MQPTQYTLLATLDHEALAALVGEYGYRPLDALAAVLAQRPLPDGQGRDLLPLIEEAELITTPSPAAS